MVNLSDFVELEKMCRDFEKIGCILRLYGGMKERQSGEHDIDFVLRIYDKRYFLAMLSKLRKWNRIITEKYGIYLDVLIQDKKRKHIYDFESRYGLVKAKVSKALCARDLDA